MATTTKTAGQQTFNTAYPFDFKIKNQYQGEELPVLYIVDSNSSKKLQDVTFSVIPKDSIQLQLKGLNKEVVNSKATQISSIPCLSPSNANLTPEKDSFNIALIFKQGVLNNNIIPILSNQIYDGLKKAFPDNPSVVFGPSVRNSDQAFIWYCAFQNTLDIASGISFTVSGLSAEPGIGSRASQIEMQLGNVLVNANPSALTFSKSAHVDIINHQGHSFVPFIFNVLGIDQIDNNAGNPKNLSIYYETIGRNPIKFGPNTKFSFAFSYAEENSPLMHFGTKSEVGAINWGSPAVIPFNSANTIVNNGKKESNVNYTGQFKSVSSEAAEPTINKKVVPDGNFYLNLIFDPVKADDYKNQEYETLNNQISNFNVEKDKTASSFQSYSNKVVKDIWSELSKKAIPSNFLPSILQIINQIPVNLNNQSLLNSYTSDKSTIEQWCKVGSFDKTNFTTQLWDQTYNNLFNYEENLWAQDQYRQGTASTLMNHLNYFLTNPQYIMYDWHGENPPEFNQGTNVNISSQRWSNSNFVAFLEKNFETIIDQIMNSNKVNGFYYSGNESQVFPTINLFYVLWAIYLAFKSHVLYENSCVLFDANKSINLKQWISSYNTITSSNSDSPITTSKYYLEKTPFDPSTFFLNDEILSVANKLISNNKIDSRFFISDPQTGKKYLIPSLDLYYYFQASNQSQKYQLLLSNTPEELHFYIDPVACVFNFVNLQLSGHDGIVLLHIKVENLPGYWDTDFTIPINKVSYQLDQNLILPTGRIGVKQSATIGSYLRVYGQSQLLGYSEIKNNVRIDGTGKTDHPMLSLGGNGDVAIDAPHKPAQRFVVKDSGNVGIGQPSPKEKLEVNGRIKDQTGYVAPVGSVVAFGGHGAPDGWLPCDGTTDCSNYPDLVKILGNHKTPRIPPLAPGVKHIIKC